tara:strand:- start:2883 stop:4007 length:1125 start_codon:yes stop_codon:yes gene_type:complete
MTSKKLVMHNSLTQKLENISKRFKEVEILLSQSDISKEPKKLKTLGKEYRTLTEIVNLWNKYKKTDLEIKNISELIKNEPDREVIDLAKTEIETLKNLIEVLSKDLKIALIPKDITENADAIMEIRAGAGGNEAGLFAADLFRMYERYTEKEGWDLQVVSINETGIGGIKEIVFEINGQEAYKKLTLESGVHRVQRVPTTESQGRIHTSTVTIAVLPKSEDMDITIEDNDLTIDVFHSGGSGGQNVNKVATAIRITHKPSGLVVQCQNERSQIQNKLKAIEILKARLWDMEIRKRNEEISANRRSQVGTGDRSEKIRTYNYPQSRITDHRINYTSHQLEEMLNGNLEGFINALLQEKQARILAQSENEINDTQI